MTNDKLLELFREAAMFSSGDLGYRDVDDAWIIGFAKLVAAAEREACARVCDYLYNAPGYDMESPDYWYGIRACAAAIRAITS